MELARQFPEEDSAGIQIEAADKLHSALKLF